MNLLLLQICRYLAWPVFNTYTEFSPIAADPIRQPNKAVCEEIDESQKNNDELF